MEIQEKETSFIIASGLKLYVIENRVSQPIGQVIYLHGYTEHSRRHDTTVQKLNEWGYDVIRYDHRGYGRSEGERAYVSSFQLYIEDLKEILNKYQDERLPSILMGVSMGCLLIANYLIDNPDHNISAAIWVAPALKLDDSISPLLRKVSGLLSAVAPKLKTIPLDSSKLSRNPEVERIYKADPLVYLKGAKTRTGHEMLKAMNYVQENADKITIPVSIYHGDADGLADIQGSIWMEERIGSEDCQLFTFEGFYHELFQEDGNEEVYASIQGWLTDPKRINLVHVPVDLA